MVTQSGDKRGCVLSSIIFLNVADWIYVKIINHRRDIGKNFNIYSEDLESSQTTFFHFKQNRNKTVKKTQKAYKNYYWNIIEKFENRKCRRISIRYRGGESWTDFKKRITKRYMHLLRQREHGTQVVKIKQKSENQQERQTNKWKHNSSWKKVLENQPIKNMNKNKFHWHKE